MWGTVCPDNQLLINSSDNISSVIMELLRDVLRSFNTRAIEENTNWRTKNREWKRNFS